MGELMGFREAVSRLVLSVTTDDDPELADAARRVSQLIEHGWIDKIDRLEALNAEIDDKYHAVLAINAGLLLDNDRLEALNAELLAACKAAVDCGMVPDELACAEGAALVPSDYATFLEVANQIRAAIAKAEIMDEAAMITEALALPPSKVMGKRLPEMEVSDE